MEGGGWGMGDGGWGMGDGTWGSGSRQSGSHMRILELTPDRLVILDTLARHRGVSAHRADEPLAAQRDAHNDTIGTEPQAAHPHPLQAQQTTECGSDAHGPNLQLEELEHPRAYGAARARRLPLRRELRTAATSGKPAQDSPQITLGASDLREPWCGCGAQPVARLVPGQGAGLGAPRLAAGCRPTRRHRP